MVTMVGIITGIVVYSFASSQYAIYQVNSKIDEYNKKVQDYDNCVTNNVKGKFGDYQQYAAKGLCE